MLYPAFFEEKLVQFPIVCRWDNFIQNLFKLEVLGHEQCKVTGIVHCESWSGRMDWEIAKAVTEKEGLNVG